MKRLFFTAVDKLMGGWLDPTGQITIGNGKPQDNTLLPRELLRASEYTDRITGTDLFLFDVPIDITQRPIDKKDFTDELFSTLSFPNDNDQLVVDFGLRYGNTSRGSFQPFDKPVLVMSVRDSDEAAKMLNREPIDKWRSPEAKTEAFTKHFDDIVFTGLMRYYEAVDKDKPLTVFITDEKKGVNTAFVLLA